jgi:hypothetical protein
MKKLLLGFLLVINLVGFGQKVQSRFTIIPGMGVGKIQLGMTIGEVVKLLGDYHQSHGYAEEMKEFKDQGNTFAIDSIPQFIIGFDKVIVYSPSPKDYPVFNMYFKNNSLVFFTLSSYSAKDQLLAKFALDNGIRFYDKKSACLKKMGDDYYNIHYGDYDGDHVYYKKGVELTYDKGKLTCIALFKRDENFLKLIADRSEAIKKEWSAEEE